MSFTWMITGRLSPEQAREVAASGMGALRDQYATMLAAPPANGRVIGWYAADSHEWDVVIIGEVDNDDAAYWAKAQLVYGRAVGGFAESKLIRLASAEAFDAVDLST